MGTKVEAQYSQRGKAATLQWYPGTITKVHGKAYSRGGCGWTLIAHGHLQSFDSMTVTREVYSLKPAGPSEVDGFFHVPKRLFLAANTCAHFDARFAFFHCNLTAVR